MTSTRTDSHRLAVIDVAKYRLIALLDQHEDEGSFEWVADDWYDRAQAIGTGGAIDEMYEVCDWAEGQFGAQTWICRVCGQNHGNRYWAYFQHEDGAVIQVGSLCASKVGLADRAALEQVRAYEGKVWAIERGHRLFGDNAAQRALDWAMRLIETYGLELRKDGTGFSMGAITSRNYRGEVIALDGNGNRVEASAEEEAAAIEREEYFALDFARSLVSRFNAKATISDKQIALADKLAAEASETAEKIAERKAEREAERAATVAISDELNGTRAELTGTILGTKFVDNAYGGATKMLLKADAGFKVWGSVAQGLFDDVFALIEDGTIEGRAEGAVFYLKGARVKFTARIERSDDDEAFGFFSRATKAELIEVGGE